MNEQTHQLPAEVVRQIVVRQLPRKALPCQSRVWNCRSCPYMIEQSISTVYGVQSADAELATHTCSVTFDDAVATVEDILGATVGLGFPFTTNR